MIEIPLDKGGEMPPFFVSRETTPFDTTLESIQKYKRFLIITKSTLVSRETIDYKKMNSKRMRKLCKQIRNANTNKKAYSDNEYFYECRR